MKHCINSGGLIGKEESAVRQQLLKGIDHSLTEVLLTTSEV